MTIHIFIKHDKNTIRQYNKCAAFIVTRQTNVFVNSSIELENNEGFRTNDLKNKYRFVLKTRCISLMSIPLDLASLSH